jgi:hypothetical protein
MIRAYCRCNSGHYFVGEYCPIDGWSSSVAKELVQATQRVIASGQALSLHALRQAGLSEVATQRTIVIEFGTDACVFDAIVPEGLVIHGTWKPLAVLDARLVQFGGRISF